MNLEYVGITVEREMLVALRGTQDNSLSRPDLTLFIKTFSNHAYFITSSDTMMWSTVTDLRCATSRSSGLLCNILKQPTVKDLLSTAASHSEHLATLPQHSATPCFITRPLSAPSNHVIATLTKNEDHR
ncbi:hypothetical protein J6590_102993 [Homalodisca vitripennis]|nr:hypothetical protein J6590_102993 [Homalodisca vitripennis]